MKKYLIPIILILLIIVGFILLRSSPPPQSPVSIGIILPLTGTSADAGASIRQGIDLAVEKINSGEEHVKLLYEDSQYKPELTVSAFNKLRSVDGVQYVIGEHGSSQTLAIAPLAEQHNIILMVPTSQAKQISTAGEYVFRLNATTEQEAKFFAPEIARRINKTPLAFIGINTDYGKSYSEDLQKCLNEAGGLFIASELVKSNETDFNTLLLKLKEKNTGAVLIASTRKQTGLVLKAIDELGLEWQTFMTSVGEGKELIDTTGSSTEKIIYPYPYDYGRTSTGKDFFQDYKTRYNQEPNVFSALGFDSVSLLWRCIEKEDNNVERVKNCLSQTEQYEGVSGEISFDQSGDVQTKEFILKTVKDGQFVKLAQ